MGAQKKSGGPKKIFRRLAPEIGPHCQFASYAPAHEGGLLSTERQSCFIGNLLFSIVNHYS